MSISTLSQPLIRSLGSLQVLPDSVSVVKELIDNAIDAEASAIFIDISLNTLDVIQVRDNGQGIQTFDREIIGTRNSTSKILGLDELSKLGGKSLGFRGVALASAAELSEECCIFTRVEGEHVAEMLRFNRAGTVIG